MSTSAVRCSGNGPDTSAMTKRRRGPSSVGIKPAGTLSRSTETSKCVSGCGATLIRISSAKGHGVVTIALQRTARGTASSMSMER
jgi:hypothetical protein